MNWNTFFGIASIICFLFPVIIIIGNKLYKQRSLAALMINYLLTAIYLLFSENYIHASVAFQTNFWIILNYIDIPLMLTALLFFCPIRQKQQKVHYITIGFILYELSMIAIHGFKYDSVIYIMGPGMLLVLAYSFFLFVRQIKFTIVHGKNAGRTLMLASILFFYGCYALVYYFFFIQKTKETDAALTVYFIGSIIATLLMGFGLLMMRRRIKELQSLRVTRKELALFFNH